MEGRILRLESEVYRQRADSDDRFRDLRVQAESDLRHLRSDMESDIRRLRADVDSLKFRTQPTKPIETACLAVSIVIICFTLGVLLADFAAT